MRKVSAKQRERFEELIRELHAAWDELETASEEFEEVATKALEPVLRKADVYNALVDEANELIEDIRDRINGYIEERSERWQRSERGEAYADWAAEWEEELEHVEIEPELTLLDLYEGPPDLDDGLTYSFEPDQD